MKTVGEEIMSFSVSDFTDLVRLLEEQPRWRAELRRLVLTEEILTLPDLVRSLGEAQRRTEARVGELAVAQARTEARMEELSEAQARTEARVGELAEAQRRTEARVGELSEAQARTEARMEALTKALAALTERVDFLAEQVSMLGRRMDQLAQRVDVLAEVQMKMAQDVGELKGSDLERKYREKAPAYFSRIIHRAHLLSSDELVKLLAEAVDRGQISQKEEDELVLADAIIRGRSRQDGAQVYLVVEVSWGVGVHDVERARVRAQILCKTGVEAVPVVAGSWVTEDAQQAAPSMKVWQVCDGRTVSPVDDQ